MAVASYPEFHVTGPVHHYIKVPGESYYWYLGTAEVTPKVDHHPFYEETFNSIGGSKVPMQRTEQGEMAVIGVLLNRFSKSAYDKMLTVGASVVGRGHRGRFSRGSLVFGLGSFEMWQLFENSTNAAFRSTDMEMGYYWPQVTLADHTRDRLGTDTEKLLIVCEAYPYWVPQSNYNTVASGERTWQLYSTADAAFPNDVRVPQ